MALKNGDKYVEVLLKNGATFGVVGDTCEEVCTMPVTHHNGWAHFTMLNGKTAQIRAEEIVALYECEVGME